MVRTNSPLLIVLALAPALTLALGCGIDSPSEPPDIGVSTEPLIGGTIAMDDPNVVALSSGGSNSFCTGTLVAPRTILTAAHCIDMAGADPNIVAFFGYDQSGDGIRVSVGGKTQHPMWSGSVGSFDVGMLLLNFPQDPELPMPMNGSRAEVAMGSTYRHVGFGVYDRETGQSDGRKREGTTTISGLNGDVILSGDDMVSVCFGDSGGPGIVNIGGVDHVGGIHSYTSTQECFPPNGDTAVDIYLADYIQPWIDENDLSCGHDYLCARIGCSADPDCEPCGADGTCTASGCALPDPDCPTSGVGEICQTDSQCMSGNCVTWTGDRTYHFCTTSCTIGGSDCPSGMDCQAFGNFGNVCFYSDDPPGVTGDDCTVDTDCGSYDCEAGTCVSACDLSKGLTCGVDFACQESTVEPGAFHCYSTKAEDEGGCSTSGSGSAPLWFAIALIALGVRRRSADR